jgi:hypothetical protein
MEKEESKQDLIDLASLSADWPGTEIAREIARENGHENMRVERMKEERKEERKGKKERLKTSPPFSLLHFESLSFHCLSIVFSRWLSLYLSLSASHSPQ